MIEEKEKNIRTEIVDNNNNKIINKTCLENSPKITLKGKNNIIKLGKLCNLENLLVEVSGKNNKVIIGKNCKLSGRLVINGKGQSITIGENTTFQAAVVVYSREGENVEIGSNCMFSKRIEVRTSDSHSIVDVATGKRINRPGSVKIGSKVWVGFGVVISKGVTIPSSTIIGANSFVNRSFGEENIIIAGAPAKIVKRGVTWQRELLPIEDEIVEAEQLDDKNLPKKSIFQLLKSLFRL